MRVGGTLKRQRRNAADPERSAVDDYRFSFWREDGRFVARQFQDLFPERACPAERTHLDLPEANRRQLLSAGVPPDRIHLCGLCTACLAEEFFSWRRHRVKPERMVSAIGIRREMQRGREP